MCEKKLQLFFLPFAGGNSSSFNKLIQNLDQSIETITVEYAGHSTRRAEPYIEDYDFFLQDIANYIKERRNIELPCAFCGYSIGSALLYDLLQHNLVDTNPEFLIFSAREYVGWWKNREHRVVTDEKEFLLRIENFGGFDKRILENKRFRDIYLAPVKADYKIWCQYKFMELKEKLKCDILVFFSSEDTPEEKVLDWKKITEGNTFFHEFGNNHFFINEYYKEMAEQINKLFKKRTG